MCGFEIYLRDGSQVSALWAIFREAGQPWGISPQCERVESGLVPYGGDMDDATNLYEERMGKYVDLHVPEGTLGIGALRRIATEGPKRRSLGIVLDAGAPVKPGILQNLIFKDCHRVGDLTDCNFSTACKRTQVLP